MLNSPRFFLRPMEPADLEQVLAIQAQAYPPELHESAQVFSGKLRQFPGSNWVAQGDEGLLAYLFAQPALYLHPPSLNDPGTPVTGADALHLHDMAVAPAARGLGLARSLVRDCLEWGRRQGLHWATLIAVGDSPAFWAGQGFAPGNPVTPLACYGPKACYMHRSLLG
ncbi:GNAT family N-acetyltransferase [Azovibrio restrictus]|uniref:GNAT family N-acetyltransferase n=1 Tax=Azovibrio restrictus TaxID=146938 RepID=UPI0026EFF6C9|nr:GNAT family N-acetyltransferase [Azovibrio restrictus]